MMRNPIYLLALAPLLMAACGAGKGPADIRADAASALSAPSDAAFARATGPRELLFPQDTGPHPAYQSEWWYYTGNLAEVVEPGGSVSSDPRRFGFQLTFFRRALAPATALPDRDSAWSTGQIYLAHFTITDVETEGFRSAERLARGAVGLSGALSDPYRVWVEGWQALEIDAGDASRKDTNGNGTREAQDPVDREARNAAKAYPSVRLQAEDGDMALDLTLEPAKPPALHGVDGYSRKGVDRGNASYYYSFTRLLTEGRITTADGEFQVEGLSWMDHEWSTSALTPNQVGWDWFSLQFEDGRELMLFHVREADGGVAAQSSGSLIDASGRVEPLTIADFEIGVEETWASPRSGGAYPAGWTLGLPKRDIVLNLRPLINDQELDLNLR
jgi:predicted secreted hydrolase